MNATKPVMKRETRSGPDPAPDRAPNKGKTTHADTASLAYRLYEEHGRRNGHELEDWVEAERQLSGKRPAGNGARR
jgi:hypothetical protein